MTRQADVTTPWGQYPASPLMEWLIGVSRAEKMRLAPKFLRRFVRSGGYRCIAEPIDATAYGFRARFYPRDNLAEKRVLFTPQEWDYAERVALLQQFHNNFHFLDIGANAGFYSLFVAASAGANTRILAVEPQPVMRDRLAFNIAANTMQDQITIIDKAVSDIPGEAAFHISARNRGMSGLLETLDEAETILVPTTSLDALIASSGWKHVDALKIDIEGAEDRALPSLFKLPSSLWPQMILMETRAENWGVDLAGLLAERGYLQTTQTRGNGIWVRG
jgi:FkbM family methyltransferase